MQIGEYVMFDRLLDAYGDLLTERQQRVAYLHVREDLSLSEISEELGITKQAVSDALSTARSKLEIFEEKLGLIAIKDEFTSLYDMLKQMKKDDRIIEQAQKVDALLKTK